MISGNGEEKLYAIVLGASSGFGEATAIRLAQDGYNIIGIHLDRMITMPHVEEIIEKIKSYNVQVKFFNHNAADAVKRKEILDALESQDGGKPKIKILVHSLAFGTLRPFISLDGDKTITQAQMEMTSDVMAHSLVYWTQDLVHRGFFVEKGRIFAMTSSGGHTTIPFYGAVSAAKAALEAHVRQLSVELGPKKIGVTAIMAGVTDTPALRKIPGSKQMIDVAERKNPQRRLTTPSDVANVISLLCQEGGEWISGGVLHADGGEDVVSFVGQEAVR